MILTKRNGRLFFVLILFVACSADMSKTSVNINGYDYARMKEIALERPLKEISGIAYHATSNTFVAVNDEKGIVYVLDPKTFSITNKLTFGEEDDYEEIQVLGNDVFILRSDGTIFKMKFDGQTISSVETFSYTGPKAEYESFYIDAVSSTLVLIPKQSKNGTKEKQTTTYTIRTSNGKYAGVDENMLNWSELKSCMMLHPSAVAVHPVTKDIYMLSSIEKRLIVLSAAWKVVGEYELDRKRFQQPEGMTFDSESNLYITNEAVEKSPTVIQIPIQSN